MGIEEACRSHKSGLWAVSQINSCPVELNSIRLVISLIPILTNVNLSRFDKPQAPIIGYQTHVCYKKIHA